MLTEERGGEDGDVEDDANGVKDRKSEDELEKGILEIQNWGQDYVYGDEVACNE